MDFCWLFFGIKSVHARFIYKDYILINLNPRYETIDLVETINIPINIINDFQTKLIIILNSIPEGICPHIITDKQWLQENILCLLSNEV